MYEPPYLCGLPWPYRHICLLYCVIQMSVVVRFSLAKPMTSVSLRHCFIFPSGLTDFLNSAFYRTSLFRTHSELVHP